MNFLYGISAALTVPTKTRRQSATKRFIRFPLNDGHNPDANPNRPSVGVTDISTAEHFAVREFLTLSALENFRVSATFTCVRSVDFFYVGNGWISSENADGIEFAL